MIHTIRKLAREIHRRSVWQVGGVYLALSWAAVAGVDRLTTLIGLPSWTPELSAILALALLPLVLATAIVQGGIPGLRMEDAGDPNELVGLTPEEVHVVPEEHPLYGSGLLTWRNTVLGGVAAATLLLASVVAYLTMWALGIGPVGSLLAQGVIVEGEEIAVATFVGRTDDPSLGAFVSDVLELDLAESSVVSVVLGDGPSTDERVVIDGEVVTRGGGYAISARIVLTERGATIARFEEVSSSDQDLLATIELLAERVRERLGESLRSVRRRPRLSAVRTGSADAMRLFQLAHEAAGGGDHPSAASLLEEAVGLDDGFALGWQTLGGMHQRMADTTRAIDAYRRALELWSGEVGGRRTVRQLQARIAELELP